MKQKKITCTMHLVLSLFCIVNINSQSTVALVFAGGGAYGLAHIGVLKVIEEAGIPVDIVVGTSMGSIVAGLYAIGHDAFEIEKIVSDTDWTDLLQENGNDGRESIRDIMNRSRYAASMCFDRKGFVLQGGLITGRKILRYLDALTLSVPADVDFDNLPRKYRSVATDVITGERVVLSHGSIADSMRASMSLPGIFTPFLLDGKYLIDGGVVDNLPIDLAREMGADIVIAVDLCNRTPFDPETGNRTPVSALSRSLEILLHENVNRQLSHADLVISVDLQGFMVTDFMRSKEFLAVGQTTAYEYFDELKDILASTNRSAEEGVSVPVEVNVVPAPKRIIVTGVGSKDQSTVRSLFSPLIGMTPDTEKLEAIFHAFDKTGSFDSLRLYRDFSAPDFPLVVAATKKKEPNHELRLNFLYESTMANSITGNFNLVPSLVYRGLTTDNSSLLIDAELLDSPGFDIRFIQPFGNFFYASPFYLYKRDFTTRLTSSTIGYQFNTVLQSTGIQLGFQGFPGFEWNAGWRYDLIDSEEMDEFSTSPSIDFASILHSAMIVQKLDSPIFPQKGIAASGELLVSLKELGSGCHFMTVRTKGRAVQTLGKSFSFSFLWTAGSDLSNTLLEGVTAPPMYLPDLADRRLFPGPLQVYERIGSHVAGAGFELKHNVNWQQKGIKFPVFILFHAALGSVLQEGLFHGNATVGIGLRISDSFGFAARLGIQRSTDHSISPFIALDLGSIGY